MGDILRTSTDNTPPAPRQAWRATCEACGWSTSTPTYAAAGEAARGHGDTCPDASTVVEAVQP